MFHALMMNFFFLRLGGAAGVAFFIYRVYDVSIGSGSRNKNKFSSFSSSRKSLFSHLFF
jgi:hypothetical protein